jgi:glycosyltransferase involved in cell wall biosynthesis
LKHELKILFVIDTLGSGGKERRLVELLKALRRNEAISTELVIMSNDIHYREIFDLGINIHRIIRKMPKDVTVFRKFWLLIKHLRPDVVHCWESMTAVYLAPVCRLLGCPLVNGMITNVPLRRNILNHHWLRARITFPLSSVIVSNSAAGLKAYSAPSNRSVVIGNGFNFSRVENLVDGKLLRREQNITTQFIVGMVASFGYPKDYPTYFSAARKVLERRNDITFLAIGAGTDSEESVRLSGARKENFRFLGRRNDVESWIGIMDIGILASFTEGISNSVMEYMALGKPVIASDVGGTPELVVEGETGFLVAQSDNRMLADRITVLLDDVDIRERMGINGMNHIRSHFSIERMSGDYVNLYRKICNQ